MRGTYLRGALKKKKKGGSHPWKILCRLCWPRKISGQNWRRKITRHPLWTVSCARGIERCRKKKLFWEKQNTHSLSLSLSLSPSLWDQFTKFHSGYGTEWERERTREKQNKNKTHTPWMNKTIRRKKNSSKRRETQTTTTYTTIKKRTREQVGRGRGGQKKWTLSPVTGILWTGLKEGGRVTFFYIPIYLNRKKVFHYCVLCVCVWTTKKKIKK